MRMKPYPRVMLAAGASGSGKTLITCGILQALKERRLSVVSFKCGPDYIDPMFHTQVLETKSRNLDPFFTDETTTRYLLQTNADGADVSVIEGVMGYYDGLGGISEKASSYDLARVTDTPVVLIVNCKGMSLSIAAYIKGFLTYQPQSRIAGVILNQISGMIYQGLRGRIESELGIKVLGYVPVLKELQLESRHLGLVMPEEIPEFQRQLHELAVCLEQTIDLNGLLELAGQAEKMQVLTEINAGEIQNCFKESDITDNFTTNHLPGAAKQKDSQPIIAVARDEAFCFIYEDNLELLRRLGAELLFFSPLHDQTLPKADGLLLYGGYPELHAEALSQNRSMRASIQKAVQSGMPCMAECGGFLYLQEELEDMEGTPWPMAGAIAGKAFRTDRLGRFGYLTLTTDQEQMLGADIGEIRGHEFHYFESTQCGSMFTATKPVGNRSWQCIQADQTCVAGFPHLYYYSNPNVPKRFIKRCMEYGGYQL